MATGEPHHGVFAFAQETFPPELSNLRDVPVVSQHWHGVERMGMAPERQTTQFSQISFVRHGDYELFEEEREEVAEEESESPFFEYSIDTPRGDLNRSLSKKRRLHGDYRYDKGHSPLKESHIFPRGMENTTESQTGQDKLRKDTEELDPARKKRRQTKPLTIADLLQANGIPVADESHDNEDKDNNHIGNGPVNLRGLVDEDGLTASTWQHRWRGRLTKPLTYTELFLANGIAFKGSDDKYDEEKGERNMNESLSSVTTRCGRKTKPPKRFRRSGPTLAKANSHSKL